MLANVIEVTRQNGGIENAYAYNKVLTSNSTWLQALALGTVCTTVKGEAPDDVPFDACSLFGKDLKSLLSGKIVGGNSALYLYINQSTESTNGNCPNIKDFISMKSGNSSIDEQKVESFGYKIKDKDISNPYKIQFMLLQAVTAGSSRADAKLKPVTCTYMPEGDLDFVSIESIGFLGKGKQNNPSWNEGKCAVQQTISDC